jgi:hypothetical protein
MYNPTTVVCTICGGKGHSSLSCTHRAVEQDFLRYQRELAANEPDAEQFVPLRKKLKRVSTGKEDNFMEAYYNPKVVLPDYEVDYLRSKHGIEVTTH